MSKVKIFKDNAWREFYTDPPVQATNEPQFAPGEIDYVFNTGTVTTITLPAAIRLGPEIPTYTIQGLAVTRFTKSGRTFTSIADTRALPHRIITLVATYADGKTASREFGLVGYSSSQVPTPTPSPAIRNIIVSNFVGTYFPPGNIPIWEATGFSLSWALPDDTTKRKLRFSLEYARVPSLNFASATSYGPLEVVGTSPASPQVLKVGTAINTFGAIAGGDTFTIRARSGTTSQDLNVEWAWQGIKTFTIPVYGPGLGALQIAPIRERRGGDSPKRGGDPATDYGTT